MCGIMMIHAEMLAYRGQINTQEKVELTQGLQMAAMNVKLKSDLDVFKTDTISGR